MKVSLSASHGNNQDAINLLKTCDIVYTTNVFARDHLYELLGDVVKFIPDICQDAKEYLEKRHENDEVIGYPELWELRKND